MNFIKVKDFLLRNEQKIILAVGFCLISAVSFGFGAFWAQETASKPLIVEKPAQVTGVEQNLATEQQKSSPVAQAMATKTSSGAPNAAQVSNKTNCAYVGSKNSAKFYAPTCTWAKRIKPENLVCYASEQEALAKGKTKSNCK